MPTFTVTYKSEGASPEGTEDDTPKTEDVEAFKYVDRDTWIDFLDDNGNKVLRIRADTVDRIQRKT